MRRTKLLKIPNMKKKKTVKITAIVIIALLVLSGAACAATGLYVYDASIHAVNQERRPLSCKKETLAKHGFDVDAFESQYHVDEIEIPSTFDKHMIPANYLSIDGDLQRKTVILAHGLNGNRLTGYPVAKMLLSHGYNILTYDQRDSGENQAEYMTCGFWESEDFKDCVDYVRARVGDSQVVGGWGSSIGGATIGYYLGTEDAEKNLDFAIFDCPVSDMATIIDVYLTRKEPWIPRGFKLKMGSLATQLRLGYSYKEANVCDYVRETTVPALIFNTKRDKITPYHMGLDLYKAMENNQKEIVTVEDSGHTDIYWDHPLMYERKMVQFIENVTDS